jgi:anaerobic selenocysteine-containing dehydrogenase
MGYTEPALFEPDSQILAALLSDAGVAGGFPALALAGTIEIWPEPLVQFADLRFPTPSGKIEIASAKAEADGHPRTPLPVTDPRPAEGRLRLLSPATSWLMNSSYGNDPKIGEKLGPTTIVLHPSDAASRGIAEGDSVELSNETGRLTMSACLCPVIPAGVALARKSRWPKLSPQRANINVLNAGRKTDMGESTAVHGVEVTVARVG